MKQGTTAIRITMLVIFVGILAYFGIYVYQSLNTTVQIATVYTYTSEDRMEVSGYLVRKESIIDYAPGTMMEITVDEGEKVGYGSTIAKIYSSDSAATRQQEIASLTEQLSQLNALQSRSLASVDTMELDRQIQDTIISIRSGISNGDCSDVSDDVSTMQSLVFRRDYSYSSSEDLSADIASLEMQLDTLQTQANLDTQYVTSSLSGVFSGTVDGYEGVLTVDMLTDLTPATVDGWKQLQQTVEEGQYIGKLITSQTWYFAMTMDKEEAARMDSTVTLRFTNDFTDEITMNVESISRADDSGRVAVVLSTPQYLTQTTTMRYQAADIICDSTTGFRVPLSAIRIDTDGDYGTEGQQGVFAIAGTQAEWKPVTVVYQEEDYCLVLPTNEGESTALHDGDTVIVSGKNINNGKVIEQ